MIKDGKRFLIAGASGSGKSYFAEHNILKKLLKNKLPRIVIFDPEYSWKVSGFEIVKNIKELAEILGDNFDSSFQVVYQPDRYGNIKLEAHNVAMLIDKVQEPYFKSTGKVGGSLDFIIDETHFVVGYSQELNGFEMLARTGRKRGISQYFITQGLKDLPTFIRNNIDGLICFKLSPQADNDIQTLKGMIGANYTEQLKNAPQYSYIKSGLNKIELIKGK